MRVRYFLLVLLALSKATAMAAPADFLWSKAVQVTRANVDWVPGSASIVLELLDDKGNTQESWQSVYRIAAGGDGNAVMEVVRASHNGQDTTAKERENQRKRKNDFLTRWDNPFDPRVQEAVTARPRGETARVDGRTCSVYDFTLSKSDHSVLSGTAWLEAESGAPVQVRYTASPLPRAVISMTTTLLFASGPSGAGFLRAASMEGVGGFLFIRKSFRSAITVEGWWRPGSS